MLAIIAGWLVPLFKPLGMGDWRICTALISGFMAKESVVSTLGVLFGGSISTVLSSATAAASILVFSLLYTPCVAAIASVKKRTWQQMGSRRCNLAVCNCLGCCMDHTCDWNGNLEPRAGWGQESQLGTGFNGFLQAKSH